MRSYLLTILILLRSFDIWVQNSNSDLHDSFERIKFKDINEAFKIATKESEQAKKNSREEVDALTDLGFCFYYKDQYSLGESNLKRALSLATKINYPQGVAQAEYHLGALTILEGRYTESVAHLKNASRLFETLNDKNGQALCLNSLGEIFMFQGNFSDAESSFKKSLQIGSSDTKGDSYLLLSQLYFRKDNWEKSYSFANNAFSYGRRNSDLYLQASALDLIGACELKGGRNEKALKHLRQSVSIKWTLNDNQGVASTYIELGKLKLSENQKDSAYIFLKQAYEISNGIGAKEEVKRSSILLSKIYANDNRFDSAYFFQEKFVEINTALLKDNVAKKIDKMESNAKEKENQNRIDLLKKQKEVDRKSNQNLLLFGLLIIIAMAGIIVILFNRYRMRKHNIAELEKWRKFQETLLEISSKYINISEDKISKSINDSLEFIGIFMGVDRVYVGDYHHENQTSSITHEWCAPGVLQKTNDRQQITFTSISEQLNLHFENKVLSIENSELIQDNKLKQLLVSHGIKSLLALPMFSNGVCIGYVGFETINSLKEFSTDQIHLIQVFSEMMVNIYERSEYIETIQNARNEIEKYNNFLEETVANETRKNIELSKSIAEQEKLVTMGEISAGIAHDLNTPLGSIQIGLESIDYTVKKLFKEVIPNLRNEEISHIFNIAQNRELDFFQSTLKVREEIKKMRIVLQENFSLSTDETDTLSKLLVECQIRENELELILRMMSISGRKQALNLLYMLMNMRNLISSSLLSTKRAAEVVGNLKTFVKSTANDQLKELNLYNSLQSVLSIFNHEIRNKVTLEFDVANDLKINGYEVKLFQLWSNLIKNALEAMQESSEKKIIIRASQDENYVKIEIGNTGEMIPSEIKEKIFEKFFSTKTHKTGTGLGLSIVKTIIEDHNASLTLESNESLTTFVVTFKKLTNG